jgi:hypothetical protein
VAARALEALTQDAFEQAVRASSILGRDRVLARSREIYRQYIANVDTPDSSSHGVLA